MNLTSSYLITANFVSQRIETAHQKTVIVLYFETMTEKSVCADIKATRKSVVEDLKKYPVKIYDYYNQSEFQISNTMQSYIYLTSDLSRIASFVVLLCGS